ncbi:MAG: LPS export ABC transporter periplasmic protein LptC [Oceanicaulis sp.]
MTAAAADEFDLLGQRRARSLAGARRRSRLVRILRLSLLALIAGAFLNIVFQIAMSAIAEPEAPPAQISGGERIVNPRFTGRDQGGRPFVVTALSAARRLQGLAGIADLEAPTLDYALVDAAAEEAGTVLARSGVFDEAAQTLLLQNDVRLRTPSGYAFETDSALIDLREGRVSGEEGVYGEAPWGAVRGARFEVFDDGRRIVLEGGVQTRLYMTSDAPEPEEAQP